jgi:Reverse transcriptase (RNA-dependent DNA polymerase)
MVMHVDNCTIAGCTCHLIEEFKAGLCKHLDVTDLGELHWMLGIEVKRNQNACTIHLSQHAYIDSILCCFSFDKLKPLSTPFDVSIRLTSKQAPADTAEFAVMCDIPYHEAVGMLNWAALATRPDISFVVSTVARFSANPGPQHWEAVKQIFRYLAGTRDLWLTYGEQSCGLIRYTDADGSMGEDRKAISGYAFLINGRAICWSLKKQEIVLLSTTKSEYVAAMHGMQEALWLCSIITEVFQSYDRPINVFCDNQSAITLAQDHQFHLCTKHINMHYHFI